MRQRSIAIAAGIGLLAAGVSGYFSLRSGPVNACSDTDISQKIVSRAGQQPKFIPIKETIEFEASEPDPRDSIDADEMYELIDILAEENKPMIIESLDNIQGKIYPLFDSEFACLGKFYNPKKDKPFFIPVFPYNPDYPEGDYEVMGCVENPNYGMFSDDNNLDMFLADTTEYLGITIGLDTMLEQDTVSTEMYTAVGYEFQTNLSDFCDEWETRQDKETAMVDAFKGALGEGGDFKDIGIELVKIMSNVELPEELDDFKEYN